MERDERQENLDGIAVIGMAARFPGAPDVAAFWRNLRSGVESISRLSEEELAAAGVPPEVYRRPEYVPAGGFLDGEDLFDAGYFGFTPREAELLDPQHRLFLETAARALDAAGHDPRRFAGRIAVYGGAAANGYLLNNLLPNRALVEEMGGKLPLLLLNEGDFLCTRVSYKLDLRGPSAQVQTACSSALAAVHLASQSLLTGECEMALAGGVSIAVPREGYLHREGGILSADGSCRAFDASASGSVGGSGVGMVVLRRLEDALADGDLVHAVIRGSAMNNDGASKVGFTAPSVECQAEAIADALAMAGLEPADVSYVEAHGSGTSLGDQIEIEALGQVFGGRADRPRPCAVGSVKTNVGHLNSAAGIAGMIKTVLALEHREIPPSLHFERAHPELRWETRPFEVPIETRAWEDGDGPRRAGVSSFGLGGTNVHLVIEEAPPRPPSGPSREHQLLRLSARSREALEAAAGELAEHLAAHPELPLADVAFTLGGGRRQQRHRRVLVAADMAAAAEALAAGRGSSGVAADGAPPVAFLFPGLGDHYPGMTAELYAGEPLFRAEVDRGLELLEPLLGADLRPLLFPPAETAPRRGKAAGPDMRALLRRDGRGEVPGELDRTLYAQPAMFVVEHALARLLAAWGVTPKAMIGYSLGEYVAATLAGVLGLEDALRLVAGRARLIEGLPRGAMLAVPLAASEVEPLLSGGLALAATNGPNLTVVGGPQEAVAALEARLAADEVACLGLTTTHAFHTPLMEPAAAEVTALARSLTLSPPQIPYLSNVTGTWITAEEATDPVYWARHMCAPVRFAEGLERLLEDERRVLAEVGPGATLTTLVRQHPAAGERLAVPTVRHPGDGGGDLEHLLTAVGRLWGAGVELDEAGFWGDEERRRVSLPAYPFERRRYWIDPPAAGGAAALGPAPRTAGDRLAKAPDLADWFYAPGWRRTGPVSPHGTPAAPGRWLLFVDGPGLGERLAVAVAAGGAGVVTVRPGAGGGGPLAQADVGAALAAARGEGERAPSATREWTIDPADPAAYRRLIATLAAEEGGLPGRIVHLWGVTAETAPLGRGEAAAAAAFDTAQERGLLSLVHLARALTEAAGETPLRLAVVANRLHDVLGGDEVDPTKATVLGLCRVLPQELPGALVTAVDVVPAAPGSAAEGRLAADLLAELVAGGDQRVVAFRNGHRWVESFEPVPLPAPPQPAPRLRPGGAYLITDASQEIGLVTAETLLGAARARLTLALPPGFDAESRAPGQAAASVGAAPGGPETHPAGRPPVAERLARLETLAAETGGALEVVRADLAAAGGALGLVTAARRRWGALDGVVHTASSFAGGLIQLKGADALPGVMGAQARGALLLAEALAGDELDFVVFSSSEISITGGLGQVDLAAAAAFLDALGTYRAAAESGHSVTFAWGPFAWEEWGLPGMMGGSEVEDALAESLRRVGIDGAEASDALLRALAASLPRLVVSPRHLPSVIAQSAALTAASLLAEVARHTETHARGELSTAYRPPGDEREETLVAIWEGLFGISGIGVDDSFFELGGHSLLGIQLVTQLRRAFGVDLPLTELFEHVSVAALARRVKELTEGPELSEDELAGLLEQVEGLSAAEAEGLLGDGVAAGATGVEG